MFGAVKLPKNIDIEEYKYPGFGIGFDRKFSIGNGFCRNCIIFGVDMRFTVHVNNMKKDILIPFEGPAEGLDGTTLTAEKNSINFF